MRHCSTRILTNTSLRLARASHGVGGFAPPRGSHNWGKVFGSTILQCILIALIRIKYQSIITSGYTMFLVTGLSESLSQIALIL